MKKVVYTAVTNGYDALQESVDVIFTDRGSARYPLQLRRSFSEFKSHNMNAKIHKVLAHQWFPDVEFSLWIDGNFKLMVPFDELLGRLGTADILLFKHHERDCLFEEAEYSLTLPKYALVRSQIREQAAAYRKHWHESAGLYSGGIILRRHNEATKRFNESWWSEICRWSFQDQISLPVALKSSGVVVASMPESVYDNKLVSWVPHKGDHWGLGDVDKKYTQMLAEQHNIA